MKTDKPNVIQFPKEDPFEQFNTKIVRASWELFAAEQELRKCHKVKGYDKKMREIENLRRKLPKFLGWFNKKYAKSSP